MPPRSLDPSESGEFVRWNAGKSDGNVGVPQAAINSTEPKHNALTDPQIIQTKTGQIPELQLMRHSLICRGNAPNLMHQLHGAGIERAADYARHGDVDLTERARCHATCGDGD